MAPTIYIVTDIKTVPNEGSYAVVTNTTQHLDRLKAESRYHTALASAANTDQYERWSAVLMTNEGFVLESKSYDHEVIPAEEGE